ncbi:hypothetical protein JCM5296_006228 [Sporobolomyces johnsonii]
MSQLPTPEHSASPHLHPLASHTPSSSPGDKARRGRWTLEEEEELLVVANRLCNERQDNWEQIRAAMKGKGKQRSVAALKARYKAIKEKGVGKIGGTKGKGVPGEDLEVVSESEYEGHETPQYSLHSPDSGSSDNLERSASSPALPLKPVLARRSLPGAVAASPPSPFVRPSPPWSIAEDAALLSTICVATQSVSWTSIQRVAARTYALTEDALPWVSDIQHISDTLARGVAEIMESPSQLPPPDTVASSSAAVLQQSPFHCGSNATLASRPSQAQPFVSSSPLAQDFASYHPLPTKIPSSLSHGGLPAARGPQQALQPRRSFSGQAVPPFANCPSPRISSDGLPPRLSTRSYMEAAQSILRSVAQVLSDKPVDSTPPSSQLQEAPQSQSTPPSRQLLSLGASRPSPQASQQLPILPPPLEPTHVPFASTSAPLPPSTLAQLAAQALRWKTTFGRHSPLPSQPQEPPAPIEPQREVEKVNPPVDAPEHEINSIAFAYLSTTARQALGLPSSSPTEQDASGGSPERLPLLDPSASQAPPPPFEGTLRSALGVKRTFSEMEMAQEAQVQAQENEPAHCEEVKRRKVESPSQ